ncbi:energy transducer TonB [Hymenobacter sp. BT523]|uniref:energy transducer TonB n=1 Tax=Hymenobacter sp. BT523 TaxID=2795725 RepID=UPI0018EB6BB6|nr:energy transducer TonB [Hymenobacter sp. BT523]MBJ6110174.1 energy transducer TonB [Hymenobacter sp. BT523]
MRPSLLPLLCFLLPAVAWAQKNPKPLTADRPKLEQGVASPEGKRTGKWNFYTRSGELDLTFDYDSSRIRYQRPDTTRYLLRLGEDWALKVPTRAPRFLGSMDQRVNDIQRKLRYPVGALSRQIQGTVLLSYTVDVNGHSRDYNVENSLGPACDQEVWNAVKDLPDAWIPAFYLNRAVPARFYLAVQFRILDEAAFNRLQSGESTTSAAGPALRTPHYTHEVIVTAVGMERGIRIEQRGR